MPYDSAFGQMMSNVFGAFDLAVFNVFGIFQNDIFTFIAQAFTCLGDLMFLFMLGLTASIMMLFKRTRKVGFLIAASLVCFVVINDLIIKNLALRIRPYNALQGNSEYFALYMNVGAIAESPFCFPSGHTCSTFAVATVLFFWLKNDMKKSECWMIFFIPLFVGLSRIYLMVHYPSDVIAGMLEGIFIGLAVWYVTQISIIISKYLPKRIREKNDFDLEPWLSNKLNRKLEAKNVTFIIILILICFGVTTFTKFSIDVNHSIRCEHQGPDFICMNEGKYTVLDEQTGEYHYYCDQHKDEFE